MKGLVPSNVAAELLLYVILLSPCDSSDAAWRAALIRSIGRSTRPFCLCCAGISRVGLKSLVESVRLQTLSRAGLQQLQLDVHYLRPLLRR